MRKFITIIFTLTLFSITYLNSQFKITPQNISKTKSFINNLNESDFSGSILIASNDTVLMKKGFGYSDKKNNINNDANTVFDIGSITKQFTAAAILKLQMQNKLDVNDEIDKYFENYPNDWPKITIHQLLTHSSGLVGAIGDDYEIISEASFLKKVFKTKRISQPGESYNYSNVGYSLLAIIIESVSKLSYDQYLSKYLFIPSDMNHTGYSNSNWHSAEIAIGYEQNKPWGKPNSKTWNQDEPYLNLKGNGGLLSTLNDLFKWHKSLTADKILDAESKNMYYEKHIREGIDAMSYYGYGWAIFPTPRKTELIAHNGGNGIFFADFWRYLDEEITIIILSNQSNNFSQNLSSQIARSLIIDEYLPTDKTMERQFSEDQINKLSERIYDNFNTKNVDKWKSFLSSSCSKEFENLAPIDVHLEYFEKFHNKIKNSQLSNTEFIDNEIIITLINMSEKFNLVVAINPKGKIDGIMID